jgi:ABC-type sugar transport system permease subunit
MQLGSLARGGWPGLRLRAPSRRRVREHLVIYALLSPSLAVIFGFHLLPVFWTLYLSLTASGMLGTPRFVGLDNYLRLVDNPVFLTTLRNTVLYAVAVVPSVIVISLAVALVLHQTHVLQGFFRGAVFFPLVSPVVIAALAWTYVVHPTVGPLNFLLGQVGVPPVNWLGDPNVAIFSIVLLEIWRGFGFYVVVFFAALQGLPAHVYEAARLDGASGLRLVWEITIPLLRPVLGFAFIMATIWNFQLFDSVFVLTRGGPMYSTSTVSWYVYEQAFSYDRVGVASTMGVILLGMILTLSLVQLRYFRSDIEY